MSSRQFEPIIKPHEHFCSMCYGHGRKLTGSRGGWWKCRVTPCTIGMSAYCKKHAEKLAKGAPER